MPDPIITVHIETLRWPSPPYIGCVAKDHHGRLVLADSRPLREPHSVRQMGNAAKLLICAWLEPELSDGPDDHLWAMWESLTERK